LNENGIVLDVKTTTLGFRSITAKGNELKINWHPLFLCGTLECNIFPLEGHPPMNVAGWKKYLGQRALMGLTISGFTRGAHPKRHLG